MFRSTLFFLILSLATVLPLQAATFCVNSSAGLTAALTTAAANSQNNVIKLQSGVYFSPIQGFNYLRGSGAFDLDFEGGWNPGCTAQSRNASDTVLDGQSDHAVLALSVYDGFGAITARYLSLVHGAGHANLGSALYASVSAGELRIENCNIYLNTTDTSDYSGIIIYLNTAKGAVYFRNNAVTDNLVLRSDAVIHFDVFNLVQFDTSYFITGNTIADNQFVTSTSDPSLLVLGPLGSFTLANNIIWNNGRVFRNAFAPHPLLLNNDIDQGAVVADPASHGNVNVDPKFINPYNFRLQETSPLFNQGITLAPGGNAAVDLDGNPRYLFGGIEMGAYEEQVFPEEIFIGDFENE
jgi:hypothetical protein